jgi:hypothetical protein
MLKRHVLLLVTGITGSALFAQTPPCGIAVIRTEGSSIEDRFLPVAPEHVKASVIKAIPLLAAKIHKDDGMSLEAKTDTELYRILYRRNKDAGVKGFYGGLGAMGTFRIEMSPETQNGLQGTRLHVEFHKNAMRGRMGNEKYATPLADEVACLVKTLSPVDPTLNPRGGAMLPPTSAEARQVTLPEGTPVKLVLRDLIFSKEIDPKSDDKTITFEVAEDVVIDSTVVIRKGALGTGAFTKTLHAKGYGRHAEIEFAIQTATAVDGQTVKLAVTGEKSRGGRKNDTLETALMLPTLGWLVKGNETMIRAGTVYDVEVAGSYSVQAAK